MAENEEKGTVKQPSADPDYRYKYLGFEVKPGKIGDLFKSDSEKESWIKRMLDKRKQGAKLREHNSLEVPRVASYEKIVLTITSIILVLSLFLPWFSGYKEIVIESKPTTQEVTGGTGTEAGTTDEHGFSSISAVQKRQEIRREYYSMSALGALISFGDVGGKVFSSGFALMLTGLFILIYMLACIGLAVMTLKALYGFKGDPDSFALNLKKILKWNWILVAIWGFCLILSSFGADYSFNPAGGLAQLGKSYGIGTYIGILGYGFYLALAAGIMNAVKASEI
ncbi:membrane hypothetical protein [Candidatus Zixiibacteriota bacterium]|nr:membrane hypothetical protein [candidate division Zixibacteria bacterium]